MKTASVGYEPFVSNPNHALPHVKSRGQWKTIKVQPNYYRVAPAAGVNASALDMGKWLAAQLGGQPTVIDPAVIHTLTEPRVATVRDTRRKYWRDLLSEAHYGLGWRIYSLGEHQIAYHSGWVSGYRADVAWSDEHDIGIAVLDERGGQQHQRTDHDLLAHGIRAVASGRRSAGQQRVAAVLGPGPAGRGSRGSDKRPICEARTQDLEIFLVVGVQAEPP